MFLLIICNSLVSATNEKLKRETAQSELEKTTEAGSVTPKHFAVRERETENKLILI